MIKKMFIIKFSLSVLVIIMLNGCMAIVKDDDKQVYYSLDKKSGMQFLDNLLKTQQEVYQAEKSLAEAKKNN